MKSRANLRTVTFHAGVLGVLLGSANAHADGTVARVLYNGVLDTSYSGGIASYSPARPDFAGFTGAAVNATHHVFALGTVLTQSERVILLVKFTPGGALDVTFGGGDGVVQLPLPPGTEATEGTGVALDSSGRIIVSGYAWADYPSNSRLVVARFLSNGSLDVTFNGTGFNVTDIYSSSSEGANAIAIAPDGKIVIAGSAYVNGDEYFALARYLTNGALDTTFDGDGKVLTWWSGPDARILAITHDASGRVVAAGQADGRMAIARYNTNASLDTSLDVDGKSWVDFDPSATEYAAGVVLDSGGRIIIAGGNDADGGVMLARFTAAGALDTTFSGDGKVQTSVGPVSGFSLSTRSTGVLAVAATREVAGSPYQSVFRYTPSGALDTTFSLDGWMDIGPGIVTGSVFDASGRLLVAGFTVEW